MGANSVVAEDLVQETMARALSKADKLRDPGRLEHWMTRIMSNLYRDQYRRISPVTGYDFDYLTSAEGCHDEVNGRDLLRHITNALQQLSAVHRDVIQLIDMGDYSYAETARILGVPLGTVMSRLSRARAQMRELLLSQGITSACA